MKTAKASTASPRKTTDTKELLKATTKTGAQLNKECNKTSASGR